MVLVWGISAHIFGIWFILVSIDIFILVEKEKINLSICCGFDIYLKIIIT